MASRLCTIFIGNLPGDVREREVEDLFYKASARLLQARTLQYPSVPFLVSTLSEQLTASQLPTAAGASRHLSGPLLAAVCTCFQSLRCFCRSMEGSGTSTSRFLLDPPLLPLWNLKTQGTLAVAAG